jgi:hypothetical protein
VTKKEENNRFFRDGPPYVHDFEKVVSDIFGEDSIQSHAYVKATLSLIRNIYAHLGQCHDILGQTEKLVEIARKKKAPPEEVEALVQICRDLQAVQKDMANSVQDCVVDITEEVIKDVD